MKQAFFFLGLLFILRSPALAEPGRLERVIAAGEVRVCIWPDYYGISFRNPKTRELKGIDIDMAQALAQDMGVKAGLPHSGGIFANGMTLKK